MQFKDCLLIEKRQLPLFIPVLFGIGIIFGVFFPFTTWSSLLIFFGCSIALSISLLKIVKLAAITIFIVSCGILVSQTGGIMRFELLSQKKTVEKEYDSIEFQAKVKFIDETHPTMRNMRRITLADMRFEQDVDLNFIKTAKMTCSEYMTDGILPNDKVKVIGKISPYKIAAIPGSFDQLQYNSLIWLDSTGISYRIEKIGNSSSFDIFSYYRCWLTKKIVGAMSSPAGGIASALITGDKSPIPTEVREKFINSGTAHILAISGLHMTAVAGLLFFVLLKILQYSSCFFGYINARRFAAIITMPLTLLYLALSGFSPSATRAFIMTTVFLFGTILGRGVISLRGASLAALLILLFDAGSVFLVSFQLSFCAVVALIAFYESYQRRINMFRNECDRWYKKLYFYLTTSAVTTIIATLATFPVSAATFNRLSLSGIFGNIIAIPALSFIIMPLGFVALITSSFTKFFVIILEFVINSMTDILGFISNLPGSEICIKSPDLPALYSVVFGGIILCLLKSKLRHFGFVLIGIGAVAWLFESKPDVIIPPDTDTICFVNDGKFYATSLRGGRMKVRSIQRNLGYSGKIEKRKIQGFNFERKTYPQGLFIWSKNGRFAQIAVRKHPFCPAYFEYLKR